MNVKHLAVAQAILAAALFGLSTPVSKLLLQGVSPVLMAAILYLGAGGGMLLLRFIMNIAGYRRREAAITKGDLTLTTGMVALDIAAPIFLMLGLKQASAANAALLGNFEIVATVLIALIVFRESIGQRLWIAIFLITFASMLLTLEDLSVLTFTAGSILVLLACICWGLENNLTKKLSLKDPMQIVVVKGLCSGAGALVIALIAGEYYALPGFILVALVLGFFAYGLSIFFYVKAQRVLGAARTSAYYAAAPFIGVGLSLLIYQDIITWKFILATLLMVLGVYYAASEKHTHRHIHLEIYHDHRHRHDDGHHNHSHDDFSGGEHSHPHWHKELEHTHSHTPDIHHTH